MTHSRHPTSEAPASRRRRSRRPTGRRQRGQCLGTASKARRPPQAHTVRAAWTWARQHAVRRTPPSPPTRRLTRAAARWRRWARRRGRVLMTPVGRSSLGVSTRSRPQRSRQASRVSAPLPPRASHCAPIGRSRAPREADPPPAGRRRQERAALPRHAGLRRAPTRPVPARLVPLGHALPHHRIALTPHRSERAKRAGAPRAPPALAAGSRRWIPARTAHADPAEAAARVAVLRQRTRSNRRVAAEEACREASRREAFDPAAPALNTTRQAGSTTPLREAGRSTDVVLTGGQEN